MISDVRLLVVSLFLVLAACSAPAGVKDSVILAADPAPKLSDYGFFATKNAGAAVSEGVRPYDLVNALFSDYAGKHRFVYVPKGQSAAYNPDKVFDFPVGSVLIKTFAFAPDMRDPALDETWIETRLLIHKQDGWVAYPYIWNAEGTEAVYSPVGGKQVVKTISPEGEALTINYAIPNRNQCKECHSKDHVFTPIGPSARNQPCGSGGREPDRGLDGAGDSDRRTGGRCTRSAAGVWRCAAGAAGAGVARHQLCALPSRGWRGVELRPVPGVERDQSDGLGRSQAPDGGGQGIGRQAVRDRAGQAGRIDPAIPHRIGGARHDDAGAGPDDSGQTGAGADP